MAAGAQTKNGFTVVRRRVVAGVASAAMVLSLTACPPPDDDGATVETGKIETPTAVAHHIDPAASNPDNMVKTHIGATHDDGTMTALFDLAAVSAPDVSGAYFSFVMDNQWGHGTFGDNFWEAFRDAAVLEFTFPAATFDGAARLSWFVTPHLTCEYEIDGSDSPSPPRDDVYESPFLWLRYNVLMDPLGEFGVDSPSAAQETFRALYDAHDPDDPDHLLREGSGVINANDHEWKGELTVQPGTEPTLFIAVSVLMSANDRDDELRLGAANGGTDMLDHCRFSFGTNSYYTLRPATNI